MTISLPTFLNAPAADALKLYHELAGLRSLAPSPRVNGLFERLVALAMTSDRPFVADPELQPLVPQIRRLAGAGETELEHTWASRIIAAYDANAATRAFPYFDNYARLADFELGVLTASTERPLARILFAGGGPLPLSAVMLASSSQATIDVLDVDPAAARTAGRVLGRLGLAGRVNVIRADAASFSHYDDYDAIILAALVGEDATAKRPVIRHIASQLAPGAVLAARSATGNRTLLYPPVPAGLLDGLTYLDEFEPPPGVINSVVVGRNDLLSRNAFDQRLTNGATL